MVINLFENDKMEEATVRLEGLDSGTGDDTWTDDKYDDDDDGDADGDDNINVRFDVIILSLWLQRNQICLTVYWVDLMSMSKLHFHTFRQKSVNSMFWRDKYLLEEKTHRGNCSELHAKLGNL